MKISPRDLLRTSEQVYRDLGFAKKELSDDELIDLMIEHPDLIQRPIVERGKRAVLGRPVECENVIMNRVPARLESALHDSRGAFQLFRVSLIVFLLTKDSPRFTKKTNDFR